MLCNFIIWCSLPFSFSSKSFLSSFVFGPLVISLVCNSCPLPDIVAVTFIVYYGAVAYAAEPSYLSALLYNGCPLPPCLWPASGSCPPCLPVAPLQHLVSPIDEHDCLSSSLPCCVTKANLVCWHEDSVSHKDMENCTASQLVTTPRQIND